MRRARYLELAKIADDVCVTLMKHGVKPNEGCVVRRIAETQWENMRASYDEVRVAGGQMSNTCGEVPEVSGESELSDNL